MATAAGQWLLKVYSGVHRGAEIVLTDGEYVIGAGDQCDIILDDPAISERHALLVVSGDSITCSSLDNAAIYVEGQPVSHTPLEPYQYLTVGGTHVAIGPDDADWPVRDLPVIQSSPSGENAPPESVQASEEGVEEAPSEFDLAPPRPPGAAANPQRDGRMRWAVSLGVLTLLVAGGLVVLATSGWLSADEPPVVRVNRDDLAKIVAEVAPESTVEIVEMDGAFAAHGYVMSDQTAILLEDALLDADAAIDVADIKVMEDIIDNARGLLRIRDLQQLEVRSDKLGELIVSGSVSDLSQWSKAKREIEAQTKVPVNDEVTTLDGRGSLVRSVASRASADQQDDPGQLPDNSGATPVPRRAPFVVRDVTIGQSKFLTTTSGERLREGSIVAGGYIVSSIANDHVVLAKGGDDVVVRFEVQP